MPKTFTPKMRRQKRTQGNDTAYVMLSGERFNLGRWKSPEAAEAFMRAISEWQARGHKPKPPPNDALIVECCEAYIDYCRDYFRGSTKARERVMYALRPLMAMYGRELARNFSAVHLRAVRETLINNKLAVTTVNTRINTIKHMLRHCASLEMMPAEVWHRVATLENLKAGRCAAKPPRKIRPVTVEHIEAVKPHIRKSVRGLIELQLCTGARSGEIITLKAADIDTTGDVWVVTLQRHKNAWRDQTRTLYIGPRGQCVLKPFILMRKPNEYLFQPADYYRERSEAATVHRRPNQKPNARKTERACGEHYTADSYRRAIERACRDADVPVWHPHQLRHTAACVANRQIDADTNRRFDHESVRAFLGHSSVDATKIYTELDAELARRVARTVG